MRRWEVLEEKSCHSVCMPFGDRRMVMAGNNKKANWKYCLPLYYTSLEMYAFQLTNRKSKVFNLKHCKYINRIQIRQENGNSGPMKGGQWVKQREEGSAWIDLNTVGPKRQMVAVRTLALVLYFVNSANWSAAMNVSIKWTLPPPPVLSELPCWCYLVCVTARSTCTMYTIHRVHLGNGSIRRATLGLRLLDFFDACMWRRT